MYIVKIFYTASFHGRKEYQKYYDLVLNSILRIEKNVISPELGNYLKILGEKEKKSMKDIRRIHYEAIRKGISLSDIVIIEISHQDFQLGHEASIAMQMKKPVLCLSIHEDMSIKVKDRYFHGAKYSSDNVDYIIETFINKSKKDVLSERFNMLLSKSQVKFLESRAKSFGLNRSEYIRELIERDMRG